MNRDTFERTVNAPLQRHAIYADQYSDMRTQELWSIWQVSAIAMAERIKANLRRRKQGQNVAVVRNLDDACLAIDSMVSKK